MKILIKKSLLSNWWQCYNRENWKFPRKTSKISVFWTGSNVKAAKTGKISQKPRKIFVLRIILSDRKISVKNLAIFCLNIPLVGNISNIPKLVFNKQVETSNCGIFWSAFGYCAAQMLVLICMFNVFNGKMLKKLEICTKFSKITGRLSLKNCWLSVLFPD